MTKTQIAAKIESIAKKIIGNDVVSSAKPIRQHYRIYLTEPLDNEQDIAQQIITKLTGKQVEMSGSRDPSQSGTYTMWKSDDIPNIVIAFGGVAATGVRGGGYQYEETLINLLNESAKKMNVGLNAVSETDVKKSDIIIQTQNKNFYIEAKLENAKFGQPTLWFDKSKNEWVIPAKSRSAENAGMIIDILNDFANKDSKINDWINLIINAVNETEGNDIDMYQSISPDTYSKIKNVPGFTQSSPAASISPEIINEYYKKKGADWIQIRTKGLYKIGGATPSLGLSIPEFIDSNVITSVRCELLTSGGRKVIRATIDVEMKNITSSGIDLDNEADREKFVKAFGTKESDVSEAIAGAITPLGTDSKGEAVKKSKKKVLDDNADKQAKSFANAKQVHEIKEMKDLLRDLFEIFE